MKKIIAAFDGLSFSTGTMDYALHLSKSYNTHLVGVFLDDLTYSSYSYGELLAHAGEKDILPTLDDSDQQKRHEAAQGFIERCQEAGIQFSLHHDRKTALRELLHESIYADLLIIDRNESFDHSDTQPTGFVRDLLADVQCPVLLVPDRFKPIKRNIFLFDGEPSSVFAIKAFDYIMHSFKHLDMEVVCVKPNESSLHLPDNKLMKEFMKRHFPKAVFMVLRGAAEEEILTFLQQQHDEVMVVLGAYRRGRVSRWFRPSMADILLQHTKMPLFIAHNK